MTADTSGLAALAADLARVPADLGRRAQQVVSRGALNVKRAWQSNARASAGRHARLYPSTIGYDPIHSGPDGAEAVIGPDKDKVQGPLGNLLEFGTARQAGHNDGGRALAEEAPRFQTAVEQLAQDLL
jgi:hypothetical protein